MIANFGDIVANRFILQKQYEPRSEENMCSNTHTHTHTHTYIFYTHVGNTCANGIVKEKKGNPQL